MNTTSVFRRFAGLALASLAVAVTGSHAARAAGVPVANASFENSAVQPGTMTTNGIPGWGSNQQFEATGVANLPASAFLTPTDGSQVGYIKGLQAPPPGFTPPGIQQTVTVPLKPNTFVIFNIDCYARPTKNPPSTLRVTLNGLGGGFPPVNNICSSGHLTIQAEVQGISISGIIIFLENPSTDGSSVFFDNVTLDVFDPSAAQDHPFLPVGIPQDEITRQGVICHISALPCITTLEFHDRHGVLLKQAHLNLRPGETGFLDLSSESHNRAPMEVIPRWSLSQGSAEFSLQVFDEDMRTSFFINWGDGSVAKTGNLDSGPVSISRDETGRQKVYCDGSVRVENTLRFASCQADLAFHDANGRLLKQSHLTLPPGAAGFLDVSFDETHSTNRHAVIIPSLTVTGGPAVGSFALLDSETGRTITQSYPAATQSVAR